MNNNSSNDISEEEFEKQVREAIGYLDKYITHLIKDDGMDTLTIIVALNVIASAADAYILRSAIKDRQLEQFKDAFKKAEELYKR